MKHSFAEYYHVLVYDETVYDSYLKWVQSNTKGLCVLECACGPGHLSYRLAEQGYLVDALDLDLSMIEFAKLNNSHRNINYYHQSMFDLSNLGTYDTIIIFLDSLNYCVNTDELHQFFSEAYKHLNHGGILLFDMHHPSRLDEFNDEYIEEGLLFENYYQWSIQTIDDQMIHHNVAIYEEYKPSIHQINQRVFSIEEIETLLSRVSFEFERILHFDNLEFELEEKLYYQARKG